MKYIYYFICLLALISCKKKQDISIDKKYPKEIVNIMGTNGIVSKHHLLWVADLVGNNIIGFNEKGKIIASYSKKTLGTAPDDLCFLDDTTIIWTSFFSGEVKQTNISGKTITIANNIPNVNPIVNIPNQRAVLVAPSVGSNISLIKINVDNLSQETIVDNMEGINGFDINQNGILYAPIFNINAIAGNGKIIKIDINQKTKEIINPIFENEANKKGFNAPTGICFNNTGDKIYILEAFGTIAVYEYNPSNNIARKIYKSNNPIGDNICMAENGKLYLTTFIGNKIIELNINGTFREFNLYN
jgi:hypothetical protein